jgi:hypothetical protein
MLSSSQTFFECTYFPNSSYFRLCQVSLSFHQHNEQWYFAHVLTFQYFTRESNQFITTRQDSCDIQQENPQNSWVQTIILRESILAREVRYVHGGTTLSDDEPAMFHVGKTRSESTGRVWHHQSRTSTWMWPARFIQSHRHHCVWPTCYSLAHIRCVDTLCKDYSIVCWVSSSLLSVPLSISGSWRTSQAGKRPVSKGNLTFWSPSWVL